MESVLRERTSELKKILRESTSELKKLPSATTSVVFFLTMTVVYGFIMIYTTYSSGTLTQVTTNSKNQIYTLIYIIFLMNFYKTVSIISLILLIICFCLL